MSNIIKKIRALKAKAEAALFAAKVQELMVKYQITEGQLGVEKEKYHQHEFVIKYACNWRRALADKIAKMLGVVFTWTTGSYHVTYLKQPKS